MTFILNEIQTFLQPLYNYLINGLSTNANNNIFNGTLINISLTWNELTYVITCLFTMLLIYLFIMFVIKLLGIFVWK